MSSLKPSHHSASFLSVLALGPGTPLAITPLEYLQADAGTSLPDEPKRFGGAPGNVDDDACCLCLPRRTAALARWLGRTVTGFDPGAVDVERAAAGLSDRPVLFIHGSRDNRLSERHAERLWRAAGAKDELWVIPEAGHNEGWLLRRADYEAQVGAFFDRHLDPALRPVAAAPPATRDRGPAAAHAHAQGAPAPA